MKNFKLITVLFVISPLILAAKVTQFSQTGFQQRVLEILRDDCANCHGLYRMGGLGPPLTPQRLEKLPIETIKILISEGVPGKFMPPWKAILTKKEIGFLAQYLRKTPTKAPEIRLRKTQSFTLE